MTNGISTFRHDHAKPITGELIDSRLSDVEAIYIVNRALQLGIPRVGVASMVLNIGIEGLLGATPLVGDVFDIVFKANRRNYLLLNSYLAQPQQQRGMDSLFLLVTLLVVIAAVALPIWFLMLLILHLA